MWDMDLIPVSFYCLSFETIRRGYLPPILGIVSYTIW